MPAGQKLPHFKKRAYLCLRLLKFAMISLGGTLRPLFQLTCIHVFADELRDLTDILKQSFPFKWNLFTEIVLRLYPNLKMFVMIISMQYDFGKNATGKLELSVKRVLNGLGERVTIECLDEDPKPQEP